VSGRRAHADLKLEAKLGQRLLEVAEMRALIQMKKSRHDLGINSKASRQLRLADVLFAHRLVQRELRGGERRHRNHPPIPGRARLRDGLAKSSAARQCGHEAIFGQGQGFRVVVTPGSCPRYIGKSKIDRGAIGLRLQFSRVDVTRWRAHLTKVPRIEAQIRQHTAQASGWDLLVSRRPEDRSPTTENDQAMPALATARIEFEVKLAASGETAKLTRQLVAMNGHCIAVGRPGVKIGTAVRSRGRVNG
jgi:hypothetical protein